MARQERAFAVDLLKKSVTFNGPNPWDPQIRDDVVFDRLFRDGTIAIGETYVEGLWDVEDLPELVARVMHSEAIRQLYGIRSLRALMYTLKQYLFNLQSIRRSFEVGKKHYDIGNDLYRLMLDPTMTYSCGYWKDAKTLPEAQINKLDLICRKSMLKEGMRVLDIGSGWGGLAMYMAEKYDVRVDGITVSKEQVAYAQDEAARRGLQDRVTFSFQEYRTLDAEPYDRIVSVGMFEHVGRKNYRTYMETVRRLLKEDGLFLLHTIGTNKNVYRVDPWIEEYIFPNGYIPSPAQITRAANGLFVLEDWHNFGADYDRTLMEWWKNFDRAWPELEVTYGKDFYRVWKFYLQSCAGGFRARYTNLWQIVLSPKGVPGGYTSVR